MDVAAMLDEQLSYLGAAPRQVSGFRGQVEQIGARHPNAAGYPPGAIP